MRPLARVPRAARLSGLALLAAGCSWLPLRRTPPEPVPEPSAPSVARDSAGRDGAVGTEGPQSGGRTKIDPSTALRFEIVATGDSTFTFLATRADWIRPGAPGITVDPRRRDALVARFRVTGVRGDTATALVTGQTSRIVTDHVALLERPVEEPVVVVGAPRRHDRFWAGAVAGALLGLAAGLLVR